jgi:hypothetical protein
VALHPGCGGAERPRRASLSTSSRLASSAAGGSAATSWAGRLCGACATLSAIDTAEATATSDQAYTARTPSRARARMTRPAATVKASTSRGAQ